MKNWNWALTILAVINTIAIWGIVTYFSNLGQGMAIMAAIVLPIYVVVFSIFIAIIVYLKRKSYFQKEIIFSTLFLLLFCTPIPHMIFWSVSQPSVRTMEEGSLLPDDSFLKTETDVRKGKVIAVRYWISKPGRTQLLKDSTWVTYNGEGDTVKVEKYHHGKLLSRENRGK